MKPVADRVPQRLGVHTAANSLRKGHNSSREATAGKRFLSLWLLNYQIGYGHNMWGFQAKRPPHFGLKRPDSQVTGALSALFFYELLTNKCR